MTKKKGIPTVTNSLQLDKAVRRVEFHDRALATAQRQVEEEAMSILTALTADWDAEITQCSLFPEGHLVFKLFWKQDVPLQERLDQFAKDLKRALPNRETRISTDSNTGYSPELNKKRPYHLAGQVNLVEQ